MFDLQSLSQYRPYFLTTIHSETIMRCAGVFEKYESPSLSPQRIRTIPWSEWGAKYAHFERIEAGGTFGNFGQLQGVLVPLDQPGHRMQMLLRNYNPNHQPSHPLPDHMEVITEERRDNYDSVFEQDVTSSLPFVQSRLGNNLLRRRHLFYHMYMDKDHLVVVYVSTTGPSSLICD